MHLSHQSYLIQFTWNRVLTLIPNHFRLTNQIPSVFRRFQIGFWNKLFTKTLLSVCIKPYVKYYVCWYSSFKIVPSESLNHGMFVRKLLHIVRYQWTEKSVPNKNIKTYKKMHWCKSVGSNERSILDEFFKWIKRKLNNFQILTYDQQIKWNLQIFGLFWSLQFQDRLKSLSFTILLDKYWPWSFNQRICSLSNNLYARMKYSVIAYKMHRYFYLRWTAIMGAPLLHILFLKWTSIFYELILFPIIYLLSELTAIHVWRQFHYCFHVKRAQACQHKNVLSVYSLWNHIWYRCSILVNP